MKPPSIVALVAALLLVSDQERAAIQHEPMRDDALVLAAVLEHTIVPAHRRANAGTNAPLSLASETTALCKERPTEQGKCGIPEQWRQFLDPDPARGWPGLVADERIRRELVSSLEARNTESHTLPHVTLPGVLLRVLHKEPKETPLDTRDRRTIGSASLSLPGYSSQEDALVYGSYSCGSLCGYGWLFVLEKVVGLWRVKSATVTVIS